VEQFARNPSYFTYLSDCGDSCIVVLGDARLSLKAADGHQYGIIVLDAFSSDAIPVHLLTREAIELYASRLTPGGVLAFHISNRQLNLEPVLARAGQDLGLVALSRRDRLSDESVGGKTSSDWIAMARNVGDLGALATDPRWPASKIDSRLMTWTDDYSNIFAVLATR
jgi:hypothetical protein